MNIPKVSVIMPVYNGERSVAEAIDSILKQTFTDLELIIVDDASSDNTPHIINSFAEKDGRIRILTNKENLKIAESLNKALTGSRGTFIVRMDADDISLPLRIEAQVKYMESNPHVTVCGTQIEVLGSGKVLSFPKDNDLIKASVLFRNSIGHSTVIFRKEPILALGGYRTNMVPAEDYDLWSRLALQADAVFSNLPEILVLYNDPPEEERIGYSLLQYKKSNEIREILMLGLGLEASAKERECHAAIASLFIPSILNEKTEHISFSECYRYLSKVSSAAIQKRFCSATALRHQRLFILTRVLLRKLLPLGSLRRKLARSLKARPK